MRSKRRQSRTRDAEGQKRVRRRPVAASARAPNDVGVFVLLAAAVLIVWAGILRNGFVSYDDELYLTQNPRVLSGLTPSGVLWAFTTSHAGNWHPITWLSHMLDVGLFGVNPVGHHLTSLLLHLANVLLLYRLFFRMTGARARSAAVALLFAVHPLKVESVAWVAERKDLLGAFFGLLSIGAYVRHVRREKRSAYAASLLLFALSLASKPMLVTLPFLLLLLDWWPLARWRRDDAKVLLVEKLPYLALSTISSVVTYIVQRQGGATSALHLPFLVRLDNAVLSYLRYVGKLFYPVHLAVLYPHPNVTHGWLTVAAAVLLLAITAGCIFLGRQRPYLPIGWLWYGGTLIPVIGLVQVGWQSMADRYSYLPSIGLLLIVVWGIAELGERFLRRPAVLVSACAVGVAILSVLTVRQTRTWRDSITLYEHALSVTDRNETIEIDLANALARQGQVETARARFERTAQTFPDSFDARYALGVLDARMGRPDEAVSELEDAIRLKPDFAEARARLGTILVSQRRWNQALGHLQEALRIQPDSPEATYALGAAFDGAGRVREALEQYETALRLKPDYMEAHSNLGLLLLAQGKAAEALPHLREVVRLDPGSGQAHEDLANCLKALGKQEEAAAEVNAARRLPPR